VELRVVTMPCGTAATNNKYSKMGAGVWGGEPRTLAGVGLFVERARHQLTAMHLRVLAAARAVPYCWCDDQTMLAKKTPRIRGPCPWTNRRPCLACNPAGECTCPDGRAYMVSDKVDQCGSLNCIGGLVTKACQKEDMADTNAHGMGVTCTAGEHAGCEPGCGCEAQVATP
jgi:hypothetical protein